MKITSDIHGCYKTFRKMVDTFPDDLFAIAGDLCDRGPSTAQLIQFIRKYPLRFFPVEGNHDNMMVLSEGKVGGLWTSGNGGQKTVQSYRTLYGDAWQEMLRDDIEWLKTLPKYRVFDIEDENGDKLLVSHTNLSKIWRFREESNPRHKFFLNEYLWNRNTVPKKIPGLFNVWGHTVTENARLYNGHCRIDTGCVFAEYPEYGHLSCLDFETKVITKFKNVEDKEENPKKLWE